jgi:RND family efflux transporter MFP subunit
MDYIDSIPKTSARPPLQRLHSRTRFFIANIALIIALGIFSGCHTTESTPPPPEVSVAQPTLQSVTDYLEFTGTTAATDSVSLVARVEGYLQSVHFIDGSRVKKGDLLFTIQQAQYRAQLQQAEAQVSAQTAALWHAKRELARYTNLLKEDAATQTEVDHWQFEKDNAQASLLGAEAQVILAKLNLDYTTVRAPFDGRIGRHLVNPGNLVGGAGQQSQLAQIDRVDPMYVYFTINERDLLRIVARNKSLSAKGLAERQIPMEFELSNEKDYPHTGVLDFASIAVSSTTGTLQLRGIFPNHDSTILPGLFVRVRVPAALPRKALMVPADALNFDQQGEYLLLVNDKNLVERRAVTLGPQVGNLQAIEQGLKPDDWVIVEGLLQAIPGREVSPQRVNKDLKSTAAAAE